MGQRILIVDDEKSFAFAVRKLLASHNIEADFAETANEAMLMLSRKRYDVTLIDLHLPCVRGIELARMVLSKYPHINALLMSGSGTIDDYLDAQMTGVMDFIHKPFEINFLVKMLGEIAGPAKGKLQV
ncbi:MAG: response regulator [Deltaproteobacteria bacterium]|nr:response regulator [Deltaproteobacteria bacterium]